MATLYQNISINPKVTSFRANTLTNSGSYTNTLDINTQLGGYLYRPKKGAFIAQLNNFPQDYDVPTDSATVISPYAFYEGQVFGIPPFESSPSAVNLFTNGNSGGPNNYKLASRIPTTCITQGVVYDNRMQYSINGPNSTNSLSPLATFNSPADDDLLNQIPSHYFISTYTGIISLTLPPPPPSTAPDGVYNFTPGETLRFRTAVNPAAGVFSPTNNGFDAVITSYEPGVSGGNQIVRVSSPSPALGTWSGSNFWLITRLNPQIPVENGLTSILNFEFHHAIYPCNANNNPSTTLENPITLATGNNIQGDNSTIPTPAPSQLTYRKFWTDQPITQPQQVASYSDNWNGTVSINSPYNNNKAFTLFYNSDMASWVIQGSFRRGANIIVRGTYQIY